METDTNDLVPGMVEAIERRRVQLGLGPGEFARAAGITPQGLAPVRAGKRRAYMDKVRFGVARALAWEPDAIDRLLRGEDPVEITGVVIATGGPGVELTVGTYPVEEARARLATALEGVDDATIERLLRDELADREARRPVDRGPRSGPR